jgi:2-polyprenyl-6-hydroxyphenyl methylase/3-demethylubiquinone-9 3-methyltransferase
MRFAQNREKIEKGASLTNGPVLAAQQGSQASKADARFAFGKNWQRFLGYLNEERIVEAEKSLRNMLEQESLSGKSFLDIGCGSGLFSLAARRLGARVFSFDYDPQSVACAFQVKDAFSPGDPDWQIERGSALDQSYLRNPGTFDVVYAWGVLHHTGAMWEALENMVPLVKHGGKLFIAIYNDQGKKSDIWRFVKRSYNRIPNSLRFLILWPIAASLLSGMTLVDLCRLRKPRITSNVSSPRGMSLWIDIVDWVGGYPFEVASPNQIIDFYRRHGFCLDKLASCGRKLGCNQFVFTKCQEFVPWESVVKSESGPRHQE